MLSNIGIKMKEWQELLGAMVGVLAPFIFYFFVQMYEKNKKHKNDLIFLEKVLVMSINNIVDIELTIKDFIETKIVFLLKQIEDKTEKDYSAERAFFPLFSSHALDLRVLELDLKSGYLENIIAQIFLNSKDLASSLQDVRDQFRDLIDTNSQMAFQNLNKPILHNKIFRENIQQFREMLVESLINKNIKIYLVRLLVAHRAVSTLIKIGFRRWSRLFSGRFKFFFWKKDYRIYLSKTSERIDQYLEGSLLEDESPLGDLYRRYSV
jgi:hypothetical protein